jgi:hypothetical protein
VWLLLVTLDVDDMSVKALILPEDAPVYAFPPPGPRHNTCGFREGYRDWLRRAAGERGNRSAGRNSAMWLFMLRRWQREEMPRRSRGTLSAGGLGRGGSVLLLYFALCNPQSKTI